MNFRDRLAWLASSPLLVLGPPLFIFATVAFFPFIALDDAKHIWQNPYVMTLSWPNLKHLWAAPYYGLYVPLVYTFWSVLAALTQSLGLTDPITTLQAPLFHLANLSLHLANTYLVWKLSSFWLSLKPRETRVDDIDGRHPEVCATLPALVFAIHPLQVEAVAWASGLKDTLAAFFSLVALAALSSRLMPKTPKIKMGTDEDASHHLPKWIAKFPEALWFTASALALLSKPSSVVLPVMAALVILSLSPRSWRSLRDLLMVPAVLALLVAIATKLSQPDTRLDFHLEIWQRPLVALASLGFYATKWIAPYPLCPDYGLSPQRLLSAPEAPIYFFFAGAMILATGYSMWKNRTFALLGSGLIAIGLFPVLGLIPFEFQNMSTVADRYVYLWPALGAGLWLQDGISRLNARSSWWGLLLPMTLWAPLTFFQTLNWQDNDHLFRHTLTVNPRSYLSLSNLGLQELRRGEYETAISHFERALEVKPDYLAAISNLGAVHFQRRDFAQVIAHYTKYLQQLPPASAGSSAVYADLHFNLGAAYLNTQQRQPAERHLRLAVEINPDHFLAHFHLGRLLATEGRIEEARAELHQARRLQPTNAQVLEELKRLGP